MKKISLLLVSVLALIAFNACDCKSKIEADTKKDYSELKKEAQHIDSEIKADAVKVENKVDTAIKK